MDNIKALLELIKDFLLGLGMEEWLVQIIAFLLTGVVLSGLLFYGLHLLIAKILFYNNRRRLGRDLHPFYTKGEIDKATRYYIPTKYQDTAPSQADEPSRSFIDSPKAELIPMMLKTAFKQDDNRYYIILADSGMGKTTFMMNLFLAYKNQWPWRQRHEIYLFPLGHPQTLAKVEKIQNPADVILLLDALDEDIEAVKDYKKRLSKILEKTWHFREVVITCRTQFFPSEVEEPSKTGYFRYGTDGGEHYFRKAYVSVFDNKDINLYLNKRFKFYEWKNRKKARRIVEKSPNLMVRPMLLSHIQDLADGGTEYNFSFQIYKVLISKWVERESNKPGLESKYQTKENFQKVLKDFSKEFAINLFINRVKRNGRLSIHKDEILNSFSDFQLVYFQEFEESWAESDLRSRSLLNRDAEGRFKFAHKSILEYLIAIEAIENEPFFISNNFDGMEACKLFLKEIVLSEIFYKASGTYIGVKKKAAPLSQMITEDLSNSIKNIKEIRINNCTKISIWCLPFFLKSFQKLELFLIDAENLPLLYCLYEIVYFEYLKKNHNNISEIKEIKEWLIPIGFFQHVGLSELSSRLSKVESIPFIEKLHWPQSKNELSKLVKRLQHLKSLELSKRFKALSRYDRLDLIKKDDVNLINELTPINEYIKKCQALQVALPNVKIYY